MMNRHLGTGPVNYKENTNITFDAFKSSNTGLVNIPAVSFSWYDDFVNFIDVQAEETEITYRKAIKQFFQYLHNFSITRPTSLDIRNYREYMKDRGDKATTVNLYITVVKLFFRFTAETGLYPNVADHINGLKLSDEHKRDYLSAKQVEMMLKAMPHKTVIERRNYAMVVLMVTSGLRTIELARALCGDVTLLGGTDVLWVQGKGRTDKADYVKLSFHAKQAIQDYLELRHEIGPQSPLFASDSNNSYGRPLTTRTIRGVNKPAMKNVGLVSPRLTAHSFRHTAATLNLLNHGTLAETQQLLRHKNINTTMVYNHDIDRMKNASETRVDDAIFSR